MLVDGETVQSKGCTESASTTVILALVALAQK